MNVLIMGMKGYLGSAIEKKFYDLDHCIINQNYRTPDSVPGYIRKCDVLINAAGIQGPVCGADGVELSDLKKTFDINFILPAMLCAAVLPWMKGQNFGRIINLSGGGAADSRPNYAAYAASKAALVRYSECVADECKGYNITVNCVAPGKMNSKLAGNITTEKESEANRARAVELIYALTTPEYSHVTGRLIAAKWDDWKEFPNEVLPPGKYKLRRTI